MSTMQSNNLSPETPFSIKSILLPLLAVVVGMIMVILDSTVVNVALPQLAEDFDSTLSAIQWTVTGYTLALSAVIPLAGWFTDRFGAKRVFLITIALFTIGSALCALATSPTQLIIYRVIQGLGGGMVAPIGMAMVFKLAPPEKVGTVMAVLGIPMMLAPALGPVLSGWIVQYATWQWIFLVNLPIGVIALLIGIKYLPKIEQKAVPSLDVIGMILAPIAFATLAYAVHEGGTAGWAAAHTVIPLIIGGVTLVLFILAELRHKQPLLELRVFGSSDFTRGIVLTWVMQIALFGSFILIPYFLQTVQGYGALDTGLILLPQAVASALMMPIGGHLYDKMGARPVVIVGLTVITGALFMFSNVTFDSGLGYIITSLALIGGGMGLSMMALNTHVLQAAPMRLVTRVTSLTAAAQQVMVSFAVAGLTGYLVSRMTHYSKTVHSNNPLLPMESAFGDTFLLASIIAAVGLFLGFFLRRPKKLPEEEERKSAEEKLEPSVIIGD